MFEYLMPALLLREGATDADRPQLRAPRCASRSPTPSATACRGASPSRGYYQFDAQQNYQYRAFGVPGLGFKRGLDDDLRGRAVRLAARAAARCRTRWPPTSRRFSELGMIGRYGLYEAIDFTPSRRAPGDPPAIVRSFMAHHQGMVLVALDNLLNGDALVRRFHAEPMSKTAELLLYERPPRARAGRAAATRARARRAAGAPHLASQPWSPPLDAPFPQAHVLSNGRSAWS